MVKKLCKENQKIRKISGRKSHAQALLTLDLRTVIAASLG
jgi:hypothetical protein